MQERQWISARRSELDALAEELTKAGRSGGTPVTGRYRSAAFSRPSCVSSSAGASESAHVLATARGYGTATAQTGRGRVSTSVRALADRGWVTTEADPTDGRRTLVDVTQAIRTAGAKRRAHRADRTLTTALAAADDTERATLVAALARLHQLLVTDHAPRRFPDTTTRRNAR